MEVDWVENDGGLVGFFSSGCGVDSEDVGRVTGGLLMR